jgi:hypothetical protein
MQHSMVEISRVRINLLFVMLILNVALLQMIKHVFILFWVDEEIKKKKIAIDTIDMSHKVIALCVMYPEEAAIYCHSVTEKKKKATVDTHPYCIS